VRLVDAHKAFARVGTRRRVGTFGCRVITQEFFLVRSNCGMEQNKNERVKYQLDQKKRTGAGRAALEGYHPR